MSPARLAGLAVGLVVLAAGGTAIGLARLSQATPSGSAHSQPAAPVQIDPRLQVPAGNVLSVSLQGSGVQVYQCAGGSWTFLEPDATLSRDGRTTALHTRGPAWVSTVDGSAVSAAAVPGASVARPAAVPELLLKATTTRGDGTFGKVSFIQRLRTRGGLAPAGSCASGAQVGVGYSADYLFYVPSAGH